MRLRRQLGAVLACAVVLTTAACGSSSSSSTSTSSSTAASSATSPATSSTAASAGAATTYNPNHIPRSAQIASSAYYNAFVQALTAQRLTAAQAQFGARCVQQGLEAAGFKTQGDMQGGNAQKAASILIPCLQQARMK